MSSIENSLDMSVLKEVEIGTLGLAILPLRTIGQQKPQYQTQDTFDGLIRVI